MPFNYKTPKLPGLPRLGGGSGSRSRRDLEEEERRRRMLRGAGGLGGLGGLGGAAPPRPLKPQKSAMFQKAGGLPSLPRPMTPTQGPGFGEDWGTQAEDAEDAEGDDDFVWPGDAEETDVDTGDPSTDDDFVWPGDEEETDVDTGEGVIDPEDLGGLLGQIGEALSGGLPFPDAMEADDTSDLDALFEDIIEGLESDIPEIRQNAMNEMNAALRRQAEINANLGRSVGGGFGGAMATTTARGMEGLARAEGDARHRIRQAQLGWLDRRLRQQGIDESEERDMKLAFLDMIKDIDPDTLEETYGERDPMKIIENLFGDGGDGGDGGGAGDDTASDSPFYESASEPMLGDTTSEDDYRYDEANGMYSIEGLERDGNPVQLRHNQVRGGFENLSYALQDMQLEAFDNVDVDTQQLVLRLLDSNSEIGRQVITYYLHYYAENGTVPSGEDTYSYLEQVGLDEDFKQLVLAVSLGD